MSNLRRCALCLDIDLEHFLEVFSEENKELNIPQIVSKHLWLELVPEIRPSVCMKCWASLYNFHVFYTALESIHNGELDDKDVDDSQYVDSYNENQTQEITTEVESTVRITANTQTSSEERSSKRTPRIPPRYQEDSIYSQNQEEEHFVAVNDAVDANACYLEEHLEDCDTFGIEYIDVTYDKQSELNNDEQESPEVMDAPVMEEAPRRRRGRPRKIITDVNIAQKAKPIKSETETIELGNTEENQPPIIASETLVKRRRGRKEESIKNTADLPKRRETRSHIKKFDETEDAFEDKTHGEKEPKEDQNTSIQNQRNLKARVDKIFDHVEDFSCVYCKDKVQFKRFIDADRHYKMAHDEPGFINCPKCHKKCFSPGMFASHMETHEDPEKNKCNICGKNTDCNVSLKKHMRVHQAQLEEKYPFPCTNCKRRFEFEEQLEKHEKLHVPKPPIRKAISTDKELLAFYKRIYCDICESKNPESTSFDNFWSLSDHMAKVHNRAAYLKCPICHKKNLYRPQLMLHIDMHNNPEKYRCEVCNGIYQNLDKHMTKAHSPTTELSMEERHKCDQCGRTFNFLANLKTHTECVHGFKDVFCNICNKYFNYKAYRIHRRTSHVDLMLMCEYCPKMFKSRNALEAHKGYHDEKLLSLIKCTQCDKQVRLRNLKKHMRTIHSQEEPVSCDLCGKTFRSTFHMKRHRKNTCAATIDSRKHKCDVCGKGFSMKLTLVEHMTTHTRTNQYKCAFCFKSFGYISNLYKHRKKLHPLEWQEVQARPEEGIATVIMVSN